MLLDWVFWVHFPAVRFKSWTADFEERPLPVCCAVPTPIRWIACLRWRSNRQIIFCWEQLVELLAWIMQKVFWVFVSESDSKFGRRPCFKDMLHRAKNLAQLFSWLLINFYRLHLLERPLWTLFLSFAFLLLSAQSFIQVLPRSNWTLLEFGSKLFGSEGVFYYKDEL